VRTTTGNLAHPKRGFPDLNHNDQPITDTLLSRPARPAEKQPG